jgi:iron(III) transport system ATP-binding protein
LAGELVDGHAETPLGRLAIRGVPPGVAPPAPARARLMLRPEQILCSEPHDGAPRGRVLATQFFGHDATARVSLEDPACPQITARAAGHRLPAVGDEVSLVVEGTALAYPD